ncbi:MAG: carboxypeptidase-like regulatory domain-containing protein, partial [Arenibacter sp.]
MKKIILLTAIMLGNFALTFAQNSVSGNITDDSGEPLVGVNIVEKGTTNGTTTDFDGNYQISVMDNATLVFSYIGYDTKEENASGKSVINVTLTGGMMLDEVQLVGSRSPKRTSTDTAVPVDVIDIAEVVTQTGRVEVNELLQYAAPSFNANKQSGSDGA